VPDCAVTSRLPRAVTVEGTSVLNWPRAAALAGWSGLKLHGMPEARLSEPAVARHSLPVTGGTAACEPTRQGRCVKASAEETTMLHPFMTAELVRQRRAALDAESRNQRLIRQRQPWARADPERGRLVPTAPTVAAHVRALVAHAS
jgi:hypothetical protein